jgi:hypothetical protein
MSLSQKQSEVFFCLLTDAGIFTASVSKEDLASHRHPLSKLHDAAQGIITEYRLRETSRRSEAMVYQIYFFTFTNSLAERWRVKILRIERVSLSLWPSARPSANRFKSEFKAVPIQPKVRHDSRRRHSAGGEFSGNQNTSHAFLDRVKL